jgi:hypothetical protein
VPRRPGLFYIVYFEVAILLPAAVAMSYSGLRKNNFSTA